MKTVKLIIAILVIIIVSLISVAKIIPEMNYTTEVTVDTHVNKAFMGFTDFGKMEEWVPDFEKAEFLEGIFMGKGTKLKLFFKRNGKQTTAVQEIDKVQLNKLIKYTLEENRFKVTTKVLFIEKDDSCTTIFTENAIKGKGTIWKLLLPFAKPFIASKAQKSQDAFKAVIESDLN